MGGGAAWYLHYSLLPTGTIDNSLWYGAAGDIPEVWR